MATDDANFVGARRGTRAQQLKNHQKPTITRAKNGKNRQFVKNFYRFFGHCSRVPQRAPMKFASFVAIP